MNQTPNQKVNNDRQQAIFSSVFLLIVMVLAFFVFLPFFTVIAISLIMAILLNPVFVWIRKVVKKDGIAAILSVLLLVAIIIIPLISVTNTIVDQAQTLYGNVSGSETLSSDQATSWVETRVQKFVPDFKLDTKAYLTGFSSWVVARLGGIFSGTLDFVFKLALAFVALFYFLRDGEKLKAHVINLTPWSRGRDEMFLKSVKNAVRSVVAGSLVIAIIQGTLSGIGFAVAGVPNATLWGTVAAICALVPGVGTSLVWIPALIFLIATGAPTWAIVFQIIWAVGLVGLIDNFLGPIILQKGINIHPLLILFSVLGGVQFFGPEGVLLGPLVLSVLLVLVKIFKGDIENGFEIAMDAKHDKEHVSDTKHDTEHIAG
jgi:predicted PurR-regulated permease PerM